MSIRELNKLVQRQELSVYQQLDYYFVRVLRQVYRTYQLYGKHLQIRVQKWVEKLLESDQNVTWKRSRNNYLLLLAYMLDKQCIQAPFDRFPLATSLSNLTDYELQVRTKFEVRRCGIGKLNCGLYKIRTPLGDCLAINTPDETPRVESKQAEGKKSLVAAKILEVMLRNRSALEDNPEFESVLEELKETFASEELQGIMSKIDEKQQEGSKDFKKNRKIKKITLSIVRKQEKLRSYGDSEIELKVDEGIYSTKVNMFAATVQSPRSHFAQIEYFRDTFNE